MVKFISAFFVAAVAQEKEPAAMNTLRRVDPEVEKDVNIVDGPRRGLQLEESILNDLFDLLGVERMDTNIDARTPEILIGLSTTRMIDELAERLKRELHRRAAERELVDRR